MHLHNANTVKKIMQVTVLVRLIIIIQLGMELDKVLLALTAPL
jgi:hypothetical protein